MPFRVQCFTLLAQQSRQMHISNQYELQQSQFNFSSNQDQPNYSYQKLYSIIDDYQKSTPFPESKNRPKTRKSRNSKFRPDYQPPQKPVCGCGLSYSSASALSIHIKNKHGGIPPSSTIGLPLVERRHFGEMKSFVDSRMSRIAPQTSEISNKIKQSKELNEVISPFKEEPKGKEKIFKLINDIKKCNANANDEFEQIYTCQCTKQFTHYKTVHPELLYTYCNTNQQNSNSSSSKIRMTNRDTEAPRNGQVKSRRRRGQFGRNKDYISRRLYMCGQCIYVYVFVEQLTLHVKKIHKGAIPDGTIYGVKKEVLFKYFNIPFFKPPNTYNREKVSFPCGCGKNFNCEPSLIYHVKIAHDGMEPVAQTGSQVALTQNF